LVWREGWPGWAEAWRVPGLFPDYHPALAPPAPVSDTVPTPVSDDESEEGPPRRRRRPRRGKGPSYPLKSIAAAVAICIGGFVLFIVYAERQYQSLGKRIECNGGELYYTSRVTQAEAHRLADYLIRTGFYNGEFKSAQLTCEGARFQFRMVVKKGIDTDWQYINLLKAFAAELVQNVFAGGLLDIHLCDEYFKTLRVVPGPAWGYPLVLTAGVSARAINTAD
jgi:hypothetical protein